MRYRTEVVFVTRIFWEWQSRAFNVVKRSKLGLLNLTVADGLKTSMMSLPILINIP